MKAPSQDPSFNAEVIKLLLQVAWADDTLEPQERAFVAQLGRDWQVPTSVMDELLTHLDLGKPLPQPNLSLLRQRADEVLEAAHTLVRADGVVDAQETEFLMTVQQLLARD
jgi:uncharacterized tellurite resistance protein B-like protein